MICPTRSQKEGLTPRSAGRATALTKRARGWLRPHRRRGRRLRALPAARRRAARDQGGDEQQAEGRDPPLRGCPHQNRRMVLTIARYSVVVVLPRCRSKNSKVGLTSTFR